MLATSSSYIAWGLDQPLKQTEERMQIIVYCLYMYTCGVCKVECVGNQLCYSLTSEKTQSERLTIAEKGCKNVYFLDETSLYHEPTKNGRGWLK